DIYSTAYATAPRVERVCLSQLVRQEVLHQSERELVESAGEVRRVCDTSLLIGETGAAREEGQLILSAQCAVEATYQEASGRYGSVARKLTVAVRVPAQEGAECRFTVLPERVDAVETGGGLELRAAVAFHLMLLERQPEMVVTALTVEEASAGAAEGQPSIVLRQVGAGETLWQIAKTYSATQQEIMDANGMEEETPQAGQLLLIPRKR
ncbi:MAG: LysM peptidoglycan-binding domain-containing protein, partial [Clostridiales bacterium]|nr:LysM peptidoglycan-binding domain-containing protein [Clostridiales bacterium]